MSGSETFTVGLRVGKYELVRNLAEGGFGVIWVARDINLDRELAIKFLHPHHSANPDVVRRFLQEARSLAKLVHPGIVTVYESGEVTGTGTPADGAAFIIMELLHGETLSQRLTRTGRLPPAVAMEVCRQVANALECAHTQGIIHRDLKSDNIMLVQDVSLSIGERAKVLDFGIAKQATTGAAQGSTHTQAGMVFGTPNYMSPEQCRSAADANHSSDIYSLGCILFELLTGRPPFQGAMAELIAHHLLTPPPVPSIVQPGIPPHLDQVIAAMLAKRPEDRPASMTVIERILDESRLGGMPGRRRTLGGAQLSSSAPPLSDMTPVSPAALAALVGAPQSFSPNVNPRLAEAAAATVAAQASAGMAMPRTQSPPPAPMPMQMQMPQAPQAPQAQAAHAHATMAVPAAGTPPGGHAAKTIAAMPNQGLPAMGPNVKTVAVQIGDAPVPTVEAPPMPKMNTPTTMQSAAGVAAAIDARQAKKGSSKLLFIAAGVVAIGAAIAVVAVTRGGGSGGETTTSEPATQPDPTPTKPETPPTKPTTPAIATKPETKPETKPATPPTTPAIATKPETKPETPPTTPAIATKPETKPETPPATPPTTPAIATKPETKPATPPTTPAIATKPETKPATPPTTPAIATKPETKPTTPVIATKPETKPTTPAIATKPETKPETKPTTPAITKPTTKPTTPPTTPTKPDKKCQGKSCILNDGSF